MTSTCKHDGKEKDLTEIIDELADMFDSTRPDDEYVELGEYEDLAEEIARINALLEDPEADKQETLFALIRFNSEWFPDSLDEEDQNEYKGLLHRASTLFDAIYKTNTP